MVNGRALKSSSKAVVFLLIIVLFTIERLKNELRSEKKVKTIEEIKFWSPVKMYHIKNNLKHRGKGFHHARILYTDNGTSTFQFDRIIYVVMLTRNQVQLQKKKMKFSCKECGKSVRSNQDAILCALCKRWSHNKCIGLSKGIFKYYLHGQPKYRLDL